MGYVLSILMNALQTWLFTKLWDSFFTRRFSGKAFWAYWVIWTAAITVYVNILQNDFRYRYAVDFCNGTCPFLWNVFDAILRPLGSAFVCCNNELCLLFFYFSTDRKGMAALFGYDADGVCI